MKRREIPGTTVFDGAQARKGYALNRMCYSFNDAANRAEFLRDEDAYCRRFGLSEAQRAAIRRRNVLVQDIGAQQTGMTMVHSKEEAFERVMQNQAIKKRGKPEHLANLIAFLASDEAEMITGQFMLADGGGYLH